jgi:hypothetical protein
MLKDFCHFTPREILNHLDLVQDKQSPDVNLINETTGNLPIVNTNELRVVGYGDWGHQRSSEGSVIVSGADYVFKIPLGERLSNQPPLEAAHEIVTKARKFKGVSPATDFFIAQPDGSNKPAKIVIFQAKNDGKPACDTPIDILLLPDVSDQLIKKKVDIFRLQASKLLVYCASKVYSNFSKPTTDLKPQMITSQK